MGDLIDFNKAKNQVKEKQLKEASRKKHNEKVIAKAKRKHTFNFSAKSFYLIIAIIIVISIVWTGMRP